MADSTEPNEKKISPSPVRAFLQKKNVLLSPKLYFVDARIGIRCARVF